jgi:cytoskeletal protein CcmA (bactofilin family)
MEPDKKNDAPAEGDKQTSEPQAPADALSRTPDELDEVKAEQAAANPEAAKPEETGEKKLSPVKRFFRKVNLYFLLFLLVTVIGVAFTVVNYLNSQKAPEEPNIATQQLSQEALKQLANSDATVGGAAQTLTIQGNAIISGQTLMRGNLNVAGNFQTGGSIQGPNLTVSGTSNLGTAQINTLQVAQTVAIQGATTMRDLSVSGTSTFSGAMTASQITVSRLILSGNAVLQVPNHLSFTGPTPGRGATGPALGSGGSSSVSGSDTSGTVNINTGNGPVAGCFVRINFAQAFTAMPKVIVSPIGNAAGQTQYYVDRNTSGFSICTANPAPANQTFAFDFFVAG